MKTYGLDIGHFYPLNCIKTYPVSEFSITMQLVTSQLKNSKLHLIFIISHSSVGQSFWCSFSGAQVEVSHELESAWQTEWFSCQRPWLGLMTTMICSHNTLYWWDSLIFPLLSTCECLWHIVTGLCWTESATEIEAPEYHWVLTQNYSCQNHSTTCNLGSLDSIVSVCICIVLFLQCHITMLYELPLWDGEILASLFLRNRCY